MGNSQKPLLTTINPFITLLRGEYLFSKYTLIVYYEKRSFYDSKAVNYKKPRFVMLFAIADIKNTPLIRYSCPLIAPTALPYRFKPISFM